MDATLTKSHARLRIEYFDHNEAFARFLPRIGRVEQEFRTSAGQGRWFLVQLEEPFEYQLKIGEPFHYRIAQIDAFLVRSRWEGCEVGDSDDVSVFLLLVERDQHPHGHEIDPSDFVHIAWGKCRPEA